MFGMVAAYVYVVEFQKRGLPYIHMLIILKKSYKINSADQFDDYVSAELPNKDKNPRLFDLVTQHMMHGPCGYLNRTNSCMIAGQCKSHYPRKFCEKTVQGEDGYAIYRRRNDGRTVDIRRAKLNNQWVVPYNPYLLLRYDCHINVEICSGLTVIKYLYKYIYKGHDKIAVHIASGNEPGTIGEIRNFQDARWVSAQEALWRIFEFDLNEMSPAVINLALHLPKKYCVTFWKNQSLDYVLRQDYNSKTMLTEFFHTCSVSTKAVTLFYTEFPEYYVWDNQSKCWYERKKRKVIGRVNAANPNEGEMYYLRLLLNHVRGPTSFDDLLIVNGNNCVTFKESAQKRGLLESDQSTLECLNEAVTFQMPHALRRLFATLLVYCGPVNVRLLWDSYLEAMSEDYQKEFSQNKELIVSKTLQSIKIILESMGKHIGAFDLPQISLDMNQCNIPIFREIEEETSIQISEDDYLAQFKLNSGQHEAFRKILESVNKGNGGLFFVNGPGGTGKTFLYRALLAEVRKNKMIALATATSGVAASILPGGRTAHSRFKIPIDLHEESYCTIAKQSALAELLRRTHLIIWDEAPMAKKTAIEAVDRSLQDITGIDKHLGGKVVVLGGDFMQVLPVLPKATIQETINASLVKSYLFSEMTQLTLSVNMRAKTDPIFCEFLLRIGNGTEATDNEGNVKILDEMLIKFDDDDEEASEKKLIDEIFPELEKNCHSATYITNRAILASKNEYVDHLNEKIIQMFPGESRVFTSFDEAMDDSHNFYPQEFLNSLTPNGMPPHRLVLKINCTVMLLQNLDPSDGLCNGTRMVCRSFENNVIYAKITIGQHTGKQVFIPRIPLSPTENEGYHFQFRRKQFPIRLCFAMTINKAQGQTIPNVGVYLPHPIFSHGQLYVALSRGTSRETTKVLIRPDAIRDTDDTRTKNVVYKEILDRNL
ncbi:uncharacterized protein [Primulina eburnea]|uniref:uncharacterized protein n=1 Tax=Primulina eburnea TaxID=1245227 RepID=UPI003C6C511E